MYVSKALAWHEHLALFSAESSEALGYFLHPTSPINRTYLSVVNSG